MEVPQIVIDTNVFVAAIRSRRGASHRLLTLIDSGAFQDNLSVPLVLEYEDAAKRILGDISLSAQHVDDIIDYICRVANRWNIYYLWRPCLKDPKEDMVVELAVTARCDFIVTFNKRDFGNLHQFGIKVVSPQEFLSKIGGLS